MVILKHYTGVDKPSAVKLPRRFTQARVTKKDGAQVSAPTWFEIVDGFLGGEAERWE